MQPNLLRYCGNKYDGKFGEVNEDNRLHGRGINISNYGFIEIGYYENGWLSTGNHILILSGGNFSVGEIYRKEGVRWERGTYYITDGTEEEYDKEW